MLGCVRLHLNEQAEQEPALTNKPNKNLEERENRGRTSPVTMDGMGVSAPYSARTCNGRNPMLECHCILLRYTGGGAGVVRPEKDVRDHDYSHGV
jgi:hypothetical protein